MMAKFDNVMDCKAMRMSLDSLAVNATGMGAAIVGLKVGIVIAIVMVGGKSVLAEAMAEV